MPEKSILIALGGNALSREDEEGTIAQQFHNTEVTMRAIVEGVRGRFNRVVITHGNGPQVGNILFRSELAADVLYPLPLDVCVADSEGGIGYMLQQKLHNVLRSNAIEPRVVTLVMQTVVDSEDPAWKSPTKYVGQFYSAQDADRMMHERGWQMRED